MKGLKLLSRRVVSLAGLSSRSMGTMQSSVPSTHLSNKGKPYMEWDLNTFSLADGRMYEHQISSMFEMNHQTYHFQYERLASKICLPASKNAPLSVERRKELNSMLNYYGEKGWYKDVEQITNTEARFETQKLKSGLQGERDADYMIRFETTDPRNEFDVRKLYENEFYGNTNEEEVRILSPDGKPFYEANNVNKEEYLFPMGAKAFFVGEAKYYKDTIKLMIQMNENIEYAQETLNIEPDVCVMICNGTRKQFDNQISLIEELIASDFIGEDRLSYLYDKYLQGKLIYVYLPYHNLVKEISNLNKRFDETDKRFNETDNRLNSIENALIDVNNTIKDMQHSMKELQVNMKEMQVNMKEMQENSFSNRLAKLLGKK